MLEALRLDDTLADPHTSLGHLRLHEFNWRVAEQEFNRAIELNPSYATAHYYYGNLLAAMSQHFGNNPSLALVNLGGPTRYSLEMQLPVEVLSLPGASADRPILVRLQR